MTNNIELRPATLIDVNELAEMSHRTILKKYPSVIGREKVEGYVASGLVPQYYQANFANCVIAQHQSQIVGVCATKNNCVDLMMVTLDHHRAGIGSLLLRDAEERLLKAYENLSLECFRDNIQAFNFYIKHGWSVKRHFLDEENDIAMVELVK